MGQGDLDQRVRRDEQGTGPGSVDSVGARGISRWAVSVAFRGTGPSPKVAGLRHRMRTMRVDEAKPASSCLFESSVRLWWWSVEHWSMIFQWWEDVRVREGSGRQKGVSG